MRNILVKNGLVYDPLTGKKETADVAVSGGRVVPSRFFEASGEKDVQELDAAGCLVIPGLIDFHLHCLPSVSEGAVDPDISSLPNGVTTCVDAGSTGTSLFGPAYAYTIVNSTVSVKALLHFCSSGMAAVKHPENQNPLLWDRDRIKAAVKKYPDVIKGMKLRLSDFLLEPFNLGAALLEEALRFAEELGLPLVVHVNNSGIDIDYIAGLLRKGDVFCHVFAGSRENILDSSGRVRKSILAARERGVIFDVAASRSNFRFEVASASAGQGFWPDVISTDLTTSTFYKQPLVCLPYLLSRFLAMGLDIYEVIDRATIRPALWLGSPELASLAEGSPADIAVFKIVEKDTVFSDSEGVTVRGRELLVPQLTIKAGTIVYARTDFLALP